MRLCSMSMEIIQKVWSYPLLKKPYMRTQCCQSSKDVARAMDIAFRYRNYFRKVRTLKHVNSWKVTERVLLFGQDIIVDLLVYRRW